LKSLLSSIPHLYLIFPTKQAQKYFYSRNTTQYVSNHLGILHQYPNVLGLGVANQVQKSPRPDDAIDDEVPKRIDVRQVLEIGFFVLTQKVIVFDSFLAFFYPASVV